VIHFQALREKAAIAQAAEEELVRVPQVIALLPQFRPFPHRKEPILAVRLPLSCLLIVACLADCSAQKPKPRTSWPNLTVSKTDVHCTSAMLRPDLALAATIIKHADSPAIQAALPTIDKAIDQVRGCNSKYDHPLFQMVLADLYGAGALAVASKNPPSSASINNYLNPGEMFYAQATTYTTPSWARPFLDVAGMALSTSAKLYKFAKDREQANSLVNP
jgi:hypothetical protein